jgi:hypothetical protein
LHREYGRRSNKRNEEVMFVIYYRTRKNGSKYTPWMLYKRFKSQQKRDEEYMRIRSIKQSVTGVQYEYKIDTDE